MVDLAVELDASLERGRAGLEAATVALDPSDPFFGAALRARARQGLSADASALVERWTPESMSGATGLRRYPWLFSYQRWVKAPPFAGSPSDWKPWRISEAKPGGRDVMELATDLSLGLVPILNTEILEEAADESPHARALLDLVEPVLGRELGHAVLTRHRWTDTFILWSLARSPRIFRRMNPLAVAIALSHAALARRSDGVLQGARFPFHKVPLVSASAQLASGLVLLGLETPLVASLVGFVGGEQRTSGGWGDGEDPEDLLTTLVAADLLATIDPGFEPGRTIRFFLEAQEESGCWRALGPELPWLTGELLTWLAATRSPFSDRFRWPRVSAANLDSKTGLPSFGYFQDLSALFVDLEGLASAPLELGFLDLAGFKSFNDRFGQEQGDQVIARLAAMLGAIPGCQAIRDGGDEFLIVGPPTFSGLEARVREHMARWPALFAEAFGADHPVVAPRVVLMQVQGRDLRRGREILGRSIGDLKAAAPAPPPEGSFLTLSS